MVSPTMGEPWDYPITQVYAKEGCPFCGGSGYDEAEDVCQCIYDQLVTKADFIRLADGEIEVLPYED